MLQPFLTLLPWLDTRNIVKNTHTHTLDMELLRFWCQLCRFRASPEPKTAQNQTVTKAPAFVTKGPFFVTNWPFFVTNA